MLMIQNRLHALELIVDDFRLLEETDFPETPLLGKLAKLTTKKSVINVKYKLYCLFEDENRGLTCFILFAVSVS